MKVTDDDFETSQPRFIAFLLHHNIKPGDTIEMYEFMIWINKKEREFKKLHKINSIISLKGGQDKFTDWLFEDIEDKQLSLF
ncbi:hypothetical protein B4102_3608 [Heyndrickxia sporothermodurans]|uniref:Uncharacterized protein n=1 Tax=Heyndrickxia sporothermodurans TaxID=46224 RepID=A0A150KLH3_9BACI|nr:hypothetical protein [Heyndrickxia sporothermodurans]KYC94387.1 hypothetical protein B4102_3608 [Heyndrickxia sporothermodurans]MED3779380.1 hypothetical protein [Heyndrickxia sporothermodurans]